MDDNVTLRFARAARFAGDFNVRDCDRLLLKAAKYPDIDIPLAVSTILGKHKLRDKVPLLAESPMTVIPNSLCTEQCSSSATATFKAEVLSGLSTGTVADLTGGLGVDCLHFAARCAKVIHFERDETLSLAACYNAGVLGVDNITFINEEISSGQSLERALDTFRPDIVYADPARRSKSGERVFSLSDYEPDIFTLKDTILQRCPYMIIKISPMEDIDALFGAIPECSRIYAVSYLNECKELLLILTKDAPSDTRQRSRIAVSINRTSTQSFTVTKDSESHAKASYLTSADEIVPTSIIADPDKAIHKIGAYNTFSQNFNAVKFDTGTHLYLVREDFRAAARTFRTIRTAPLDRNGLREITKGITQAETSAKNIPLSSAQLAAKLKIKPGGPYHIWGCRAAGKNILILTEPVSL